MGQGEGERERERERDLGEEAAFGHGEEGVEEDPPLALPQVHQLPHIVISNYIIIHIYIVVL